MTALFWIAAVIGGLSVAALLAGQAGALTGRQPGDLGVHDGRLKGLSATDNCVSSQASLYPAHPRRSDAEIAPISLQGDGPATLSRIATVIVGLPGARIVEQRSDYLYAQFTTRLMKFVDDVEFWYDPGSQAIQVRSASRVGSKDLGANRKRVEAIRSALTTS